MKDLLLGCFYRCSDGVHVVFAELIDRLCQLCLSPAVSPLFSM